MRTLLLAGALFCVASAAQAQTDKRFDRADSNHDGRISLQEYESFAGNRMMKAKGKHAQKFRTLDPEQQAALLERRFHKLDRDHKGFLVPADLPRRRQG